MIAEQKGITVGTTYTRQMSRTKEIEQMRTNGGLPSAPPLMRSNSTTTNLVGNAQLEQMDGFLLPNKGTDPVKTMSYCSRVLV